MKILIRAEGHNIRIGFPTAWIFSKPMARLFLAVASKAVKHGGEQAYNVFTDIPPEAVYALCRELCRVKKKHGKWELIEAESSDGERVLIYL